MKAALKYIAMSLFTIEITLICLFLPSQISKWQDQQSFGAVHLEDTEDITVERDQQMTILEKLELLINPKTAANQINIQQGKYLKAEEIPQICDRELRKLKELGVLLDINVDLDAQSPRIIPTFYLSMEDPTKSMIVWNVEYLEEKSFISLSLDDETGKILSFSEKTVQQIVNTDADTFLKEMSQYYGITVDDYQMKRTSTDKKYDTSWMATYVIASFSEGEKLLKCGIQISPYGWIYFE